MAPAVTARARDGQAGISLIETVFATTLLLVVLAGLGSMGIVGLTATENQGHLAARATEYAQDKMEQMLSLAWGDETSDTRVFPAVNAGGTGLAVGGSANPGAPVDGYVDYLDRNGNLLPSAGGAPANWFYIRVWQVTLVQANLKQISVTATTTTALGRQDPPSATVTALKSFPF